MLGATGEFVLIRLAMHDAGIHVIGQGLEPSNEKVNLVVSYSIHQLYLQPSSLACRLSINRA